jgi:hypothetical protein
MACVTACVRVNHFSFGEKAGWKESKWLKTRPDSAFYSISA